MSLKSSISGFSCFKIYIFKHVKKNEHPLLTAREGEGGGVCPLKIQVFSRATFCRAINKTKAVQRGLLRRLEVYIPQLKKDVSSHK